MYKDSNTDTAADAANTDDDSVRVKDVSEDEEVEEEEKEEKDGE